MQPVMETILHRRSIRRFAPEQIREETLAQILQAGLYAPSAGGRQGVLFAVCQDRAVNTRLGKIKRANAKPRMAKTTSPGSSPALPMTPTSPTPSTAPPPW